MEVTHQSEVLLDSQRRLPRGACDCHFHVYDAARFPYAATRSYTPEDAPLADFKVRCAAAGIDRAVLIHPSVFGADHASFEQTLLENQDWLRGVAVVYPDTPDSQIERWHRLGARGSRVNAMFAGGPSTEDVRRIVESVKGRNWHVQLLIDLAEQPTLPGTVADMGVPVVIDHLGYHAPDALLESRGFANLLSLLREGSAWVKLSAPYRVSRQAPGYADLRPLLDALIDANPERLVWGSDFPHSASPTAVPAHPALIDLIFQWLPTAGLRQSVMADNPARLYWDETPE